LKISALGGIVLALAGIAVGLYLDGGRMGQLLQPTAALIVAGGTLGALLVNFPLAVVLRASRQLRAVFFGIPNPALQVIADLTRYAIQARRSGIMSLDDELEVIADPFFRRCLTLAVDGATSNEVRQTMDVALETETADDVMLARVFESAGGFAPTIGILGAVIGLIQVMQKMENIGEVGRGIAVAFVATIYGVGAANLFFLPCAGRIRILTAERQLLREMIVDGVCGIVDNANPRALEQRLTAYVSKPAPRPSLVVSAK
jgi:chemotaxis protein MotA